MPVHLCCQWFPVFDLIDVFGNAFVIDMKCTNGNTSDVCIIEPNFQVQDGLESGERYSSPVQMNVTLQSFHKILHKILNALSIVFTPFLHRLSTIWSYGTARKVYG